MKQIDLKDQYFGTEIEMTGISRYNAAAAVGRMFGTEPYSISSYRSWCVKDPQEPLFTITATDRHGVIYHGRIRRLTPRECLRLQGYRDEEISKMEKETSDNQLYKQAGNGVTVNVIEAIGRNLKAVDEEIQSGSPVPEAKGG